MAKDVHLANCTLPPPFCPHGLLQEMVDNDEIPDNSAVAVLSDAVIVLPLGGIVDQEVEQARLSKKQSNLEKRILPLQTKLSNESFISKAPKHVVDETRLKLTQLESELKSIMESQQRAGKRFSVHYY